MIYAELKNEYNETYLQVEYSEEVQAVIMHWIGFSTHEELIEGMDTGLSCLIENKSTRWVADASRMEGGFTDSNDWLEQDWTPRAQKAGLKTVAFVVSPDIFNEFSTNEYAERNADLDNPHFTSVEDAINWIKGK